MEFERLSTKVTQIYILFIIFISLHLKYCTDINKSIVHKQHYRQYDKRTLQTVSAVKKNVFSFLHQK